MSMKQVAGTAIIPTLARVVLCAAFVTQGYNKVFNDVDYTGDAAQRLIELDVIQPEPVTASIDGVTFHAASYQDEQAEDPPADLVDPATEDPPAADPPAEDASSGDDDATMTADPEPEPVVTPDGVYRARAMYKVTLMVDGEGWPQPVWAGRVAAFTELIGGALLLLGVFSRVWGLGLAITMGVAFYLTSMTSYIDDPLGAASGINGYALFNQTFTQLGLFVLAFGIFLTGPGPLSIDRLLFRPRDKGDVDDVAFT